MDNERGESRTTGDATTAPEGPQQSTPINVGQQSSTGSGLDPKIASLLAYFFGLIGGLIFLVIEKENKFVRFSALQSIFFSVALIIVWIAYTVVASIIGIIPVLGFLINTILWAIIAIGGLVYWIILMMKALQGETYKLPIIGDMVEQKV